MRLRSSHAASVILTKVRTQDTSSLPPWLRVLTFVRMTGLGGGRQPLRGDRVQGVVQCCGVQVCRAFDQARGVVREGVTLR